MRKTLVDASEAADKIMGVILRLYNERREIEAEKKRHCKKLGDLFKEDEILIGKKYEAQWKRYPVSFSLDDINFLLDNVSPEIKKAFGDRRRWSSPFIVVTKKARHGR